MQPEWGDIRIFLAVAATGSYAKAARRTRLSVATIGRRVETLEATLGARLFERLPGGHRLTGAGEALVPAAGRMAAAADDFIREASLARDRAVPAIRLWGQEWEASFLASNLPFLHAATNGTATLELVMSHNAVSLARREADVLLATALPRGGDTVSRRLGRMEFAIFGAPGFIAANPAALTEARYRDCDWVGFNADHAYFDIAKWLDEQCGGVPPRHRCGNANVIIDAVRAGAGLTPLPCWLGDHDPRLARASAVIPALARDIWWLIHPELQDWPPMRRVLDGLIALFHDQSASLAGTKCGCNYPRHRATDLSAG